MVILKRETSCLSAKKQGNLGRGKLTDHHDWVRIREKGDMTLDTLVVELEQRCGVKVHRASVGDLPPRLPFFQHWIRNSSKYQGDVGVSAVLRLSGGVLNANHFATLRRLYPVCRSISLQDRSSVKNFQPSDFTA